MSKNLWLNSVRQAIYAYSHRSSRKVRCARWISGELLELRIAPGDLAGITSAFAAPPITEFLQGDPFADSLPVTTTSDVIDISISTTNDFYIGSLEGRVESLSMRTLSV